MIFWSVLMLIFVVLTTISLVSGVGADLGLDLDLDIDIDGDVDADIGGTGGSGSGSFLQAFCIFLNIGSVPITFVIMTIVALNWGIGLELNQAFNSSHNIFIGWLMAGITFCATLPVSKFLTWPLKKFFKALNEDEEDQIKIIGNICETITTVTHTSGQANIKDGPTLVGLMVKCEEGISIEKGKKAIILEKDEKANRYVVSQVEDNLFN